MHARTYARARTHTGAIVANFTVVGEWGGFNESTLFRESFGRINDAFPWLAHPPLGVEECAWDYYDWSTLRIRPVSFAMSASAGMIPHLGEFNWLAEGAIAFEVDVQLYISSPVTCPHEAP